MNEGNIERWFIGFIIGIVLIGAFGITMSIRQSSSFIDKCHAAGGIPERTKGDLICLSPGSIVQIP